MFEFLRFLCCSFLSGWRIRRSGSPLDGYTQDGGCETDGQKDGDGLYVFCCVFIHASKIYPVSSPTSGPSSPKETATTRGKNRVCQPHVVLSLSRFRTGGVRIVRQARKPVISMLQPLSSPPTQTACLLRGKNQPEHGRATCLLPRTPGSTRGQNRVKVALDADCAGLLRQVRGERVAQRREPPNRTAQAGNRKGSNRSIERINECWMFEATSTTNYTTSVK